jgi:hypothetical protein
MNTTNTTNTTNTINDPWCPVVLEMQRSFPDEWHYRIANTPFDTRIAQELRHDAYLRVFQQLEKEQEIREKMDSEGIEEPDTLSEKVEVEEEDDDYDEDMERAIAMECFKRRLAAEERKRPKCQGCNESLETTNKGSSCVHCIFALKSNII